MAKGRIEKRGARKRQVKPIVLIVTEGSRTEPKYFEHFKTRQTNIDVRVVGNRSNSGETDYGSLIRKAQEFQKKNQLSSDNGDSVWVVADGDVNYNNPDPVATKNKQLKQSRKIAERSGIRLVISNPCFEFWYLLHFRYTTKHYRDFEAVNKDLSAFLPDYGKTDDVYEQLLSMLEQAIHNAKRIEQYHMDAGELLPFEIGVNPYTDVYKLIEMIK